jgi:hypothetical protein
VSWVPVGGSITWYLPLDSDILKKRKREKREKKLSWQIWDELKKTKEDQGELLLTS